MAAYLLAEAKISDPLAYATYQSLAQAAIALYGGRYRARGGRLEVFEGDCRRVRFPRTGQEVLSFCRVPGRARRTQKCGRNEYPGRRGITNLVFLQTRERS